MKLHRDLHLLHPLLRESALKIQKEIINVYNVPIRVFETGRNSDRHSFLLSKGKTKDIVSCHLCNLLNDPPLYSTAIDYVFYDDKWSWNLRDSTVMSWYTLFGNLVLDLCPELQWSGMNRKAINFCHFKLKQDIIIANLKMIPCVTL